MAGIYIHIPFCKQACHYCDFHFSTNLSYKSAMVQAIMTEAALQKGFLKEHKIKTIYFGGGTPSLLSSQELELILNTLAKNFDLSQVGEITLEANPDDLSREKLTELKQLGINRLSIGIQSFHEPFLQMMNRAHTAQEALQVVDHARAAGFDKLSIDLIYAIPHADHTIWQKDLAIAMSIDPGHISSYCLTVEPGTALGRWQTSGKFEASSDDFAADQFELLLATMDKHGYEQYEISNFAKEGHHSQHNSAYWQYIPYLGLGPGAHSFDGEQRQHNISHNPKYIKSLQADLIPATIDHLSPSDQLNEYILTSLRTKWGTSLEKIANTWQITLDLNKIHNFIQDQLLSLEHNTLKLTPKGRLLADQIAMELFVEDMV